MPVLLVIPLAGSRLTAVIFGGILLFVGLIGLWQVEPAAAAGRFPVDPDSCAICLAVVDRELSRATKGSFLKRNRLITTCRLCARENCNYLLLNEGQAYHSFYCDGGRVPRISVWSMMLAAPYFNAAPVDVDKLGVIGLAAGTIPKQYTRVFG